MPRTSANHDQAAGLRRMLGLVGPRVLPVAGGADGRERAAIVVEMAAAASAQGYSVVVLDQSKGDVAKILGLRPRYELHHLLSGEKEFHEVAMESALGLRLLPASRGIAELAGQPGHVADFFNAFARVERPANLVILNIQDATIAAELMPRVDADVLLVVAPSAASMTGAYTHVKQLVNARGIVNYRVLIADVESEPESQRTFDKLASVAGKFLRARLQMGGSVPSESNLTAARKTGSGSPASSAGSPAASAFHHIVAGLPAWNLFESTANASTH